MKSTNNYAILDLALRYRETFLFNQWRMGMNSIEKGQTDNWTITPKRIEALKAAAPPARQRDGLGGRPPAGAGRNTVRRCAAGAGGPAEGAPQWPMPRRQKHRPEMRRQAGAAEEAPQWPMPRRQTRSPGDVRRREQEMAEGAAPVCPLDFMPPSCTIRSFATPEGTSVPPTSPISGTATKFVNALLEDGYHDQS